MALTGYDSDKDEQARVDRARHSNGEGLDVDTDQRRAEIRDLENNYNAPSAEEPSFFNPDGESSDKVTSPEDVRGQEEATGGVPLDQVGNGLNLAEGAEGTGKIKRFVELAGRRKLIGGATLGIVGTIIVFALSIGSGPAQFIQFAQELVGAHLAVPQGEGDDRLFKEARFIRYAKDHPEKTRLNALGNTVADKIEARFNANGIQTAYSSLFGFRDGYVIDPSNENYKGKTAEELSKQLGVEVKDGALVSPELNGKYFIDSKQMGYLKNNRLSRTMMQESGYSKVSAYIGARVMGARAGIDWHPIKKLDKKVMTSVEDRYNAWKKNQVSEVENGAPTAALDSEDGTAKDQNGKPVDPNAESNASQAQDASTSAQQEASDVGSKVKTGDTGSLDAFTHSTSLKLTAGGAGAVGLLCVAEGISANADELRDTQVILPMMRIGMGIVTFGYQIMSGQGVDLEQMGFKAKQLQDVVKKTNWASARTSQATRGQALTGPDLPEEDRPTATNNWLGNILNNIPGLHTVCKGFNSPIGQVASFGVSFIGGPVSAVVMTAVGAAVMPKLSSYIAHWMAGTPVNPFPVGAELGNIAHYGVFLAADQQGISGGGRVLTKQETSLLNNANAADQQQQFQGKSFAYRMFDPNDSRTLVGRMISPINPSVSANLYSASTAFATMGSSILNLPGLFTAHAAAADTYDYGMPQVAFSVDEMNNPDTQNPFANGDKVADILAGPNGQTYLDRVQKCFGDSIDSTNQYDVKFDLTNPISLDDFSKNSDCSDTSEDWLRVRFYIQDTMDIKSVACYEGDDQSCADLGMTPGTSTTTVAGADTLGQSDDGFTFPLQGVTKSSILNMNPHWCSTSQESCHHDYNAADIFSPTGTVVVAARGGTVTSAKDNKDNPSSVGTRVSILGDDGKLYYYAHMGTGTLAVHNDQKVGAGTVLGKIGTKENAEGTEPHLHIDILPGDQYKYRPVCTFKQCTGFPFINPQPALIDAFNHLKDQ